MKITEVETLQMGEFPNLLYVRLHTDEGLVGWSEYNESYGSPGLTAVIEQLHVAQIVEDVHPLTHFTGVGDVGEFAAAVAIVDRA